jgi:hypothetical protein
MPPYDEPETVSLFQDEANEANLNKPIDSFYPYSWFLTNMFAYMTFAGPMPMMYLFGILHWYLSFWAYKFLFVWYNRKTPGFDETLPVWSIYLLKWALFLHLLFNLFMFTNKRILSPPGYTEEPHYRPKGEPVGKFFARRFDAGSSQMVFLMFIVICVCYLIYATIIIPCRNCARERKKVRESKSGDDIDVYDHTKVQEEYAGKA